MKKIRSIGFALLLGVGFLIPMNACDEDDPEPSGSCSGVYQSEQECLDEIKGANNCKCEFENGKWRAIPTN